MFNVASIKKCTEVEGPFRRFAIWFQGCDIGCEGCCNKELQPFVKKHLMSTEELYDAIIQSKNEFSIEGVTFLGGEPTLQKDLPTLCKMLHNDGLGLILFTGHTISELSKNLVNNVDLIIDGRFQKDHLDYERNMIGSVNQKMNFITERYKSSEKWFCEKRDFLVEYDCIDGYINSNGDII